MSEWYSLDALGLGRVLLTGIALVWWYRTLTTGEAKSPRSPGSAGCKSTKQQALQGAVNG